jgi:hypothetical protein
MKKNTIKKMNTLNTTMAKKMHSVYSPQLLKTSFKACAEARFSLKREKSYWEICHEVKEFMCPMDVGSGTRLVRFRRLTVLGFYNVKPEQELVPHSQCSLGKIPSFSLTSLLKHLTEMLATIFFKIQNKILVWPCKKNVRKHKIRWISGKNCTC